MIYHLVSPWPAGRSFPPYDDRWPVTVCGIVKPHGYAATRDLVTCRRCRRWHRRKGAR